MSGYRKVPEEGRNGRAFCKERAADKLENLEAERGQLLATNAYALLTSDYFFIRQNTNVRYSREQIVQCFWIRENLQDQSIHKSKKL